MTIARTILSLLLRGQWRSRFLHSSKDNRKYNLRIGQVLNKKAQKLTEKLYPSKMQRQRPPYA